MVELVMEFHSFLVLFGLVANLSVLVLAIKKFGILENLFMIHWKKFMLGMFFTLLGFTAWGVAELVEGFSAFLYRQFLTASFFLLSLVQVIHLFILHKKVVKSAL